MMRTTLDVDDDVLAAVEERARLENSTAGEILSRLARQALTGQGLRLDRSAAGFLTLPKRGHVATTDHVNAIRDTEGI
jgi:Arc/MetJ family transcription regulator